MSFEDQVKGWSTPACLVRRATASRKTPKQNTMIACLQDVTFEISATERRYDSPKR